MEWFLFYCKQNKYMAKKSAGILVYRKSGNEYEVFLVHPGGPFWAKKDLNAWSVPKGEFIEGEDPLTAAIREFREETGQDISGEFFALDPVRQPGGKIVYTWAVEANPDASNIKSNTFEIEWPPRSGKKIEIPEVDKAGWFTFEEARVKILKGQVPLLDQFASILNQE
jgi:predicted NUDIX family NTP pyrophosphohydrolase